MKKSFLKTYLIIFLIINLFNLIFGMKHYLFSPNLETSTISDFFTFLEIPLFILSIGILVFYKKLEKSYFRLLLFYSVGYLAIALLGGILYFTTGVNSYDLSALWNRIGYFITMIFYIITIVFGIYLLKYKRSNK